MRSSPNGGSGVGSLSVIDTGTGTILRTLITSTSSGVINNSNFAITGNSAAVVAVTANKILLSVVNLNTGKIAAQKLLPIPSTSPAGVAANAKTRFIYLTYLDSNANTQIQKIDPATLAVILDVNLGSSIGPGMAVSPDGRNIYLTGYGYPEVAAAQAF